MKLGAIGALGGASLVALSLVLTPALAASSQKAKKARPAPSISSGMVSSFTPAVADPRLAAAFARRDFQAGSFRFTPSSASPAKGKAVRVAVRARSATPETVRAGGASGAAVAAITPTAYNLGVAVGWKRFALSGDVARVQNGPIPGEREAAEVGVSYALKKFTGRVQVGAERAEGSQRLVGPDDTYQLDVGGSYSIARNVAVTGGVRYKIDRERLEPLADDRRDSQAVYIGTAFRF
ncbi:MAG TPA: porin [Allosphingosinicella sp.]|nr:porin [Allosphingosinicella sp.]